MGEQLSIEHRIAQAERRWPGLQFKRKGSEEASSPCPFEGRGDDRFLIFSDGGYWCRRCGANGWLDDNEQKKLSRERLLELRVAELERKQREQDARLSALERMHRCTDHLRYHSQMTPEQRKHWYGEGIFDEAISQFQLGYAHSCPTHPASPSYTIPVYGHDGELINIRHRLVNPSGGKYRPHISGLGQQLYGAHLLRDQPERVTLWEGEKKTVVMHQAGFPGVGLMGKSFRWRKEWFEWFDPRQDIFIALDPDALPNAWRLAGLFRHNGFRSVRVCDFPVKPDDAINIYGAGALAIERILSQARPV